MKIRKAKYEELPVVLEIYETARQFMREHGNEKQWRDGYPQRELVEQDIEKGRLYICEDVGTAAGVFMFTKEPDPDYERIYEGKWLNEKPYGVMHRMAASGKRKGVAAFCLDWCFAQCGNVKGDTHADNVIMQRVFEKNGFQKCGIVYLKDKTARIAYQKEEKNGAITEK